MLIGWNVQQYLISMEFSSWLVGEEAGSATIRTKLMLHLPKVSALSEECLV